MRNKEIVIPKFLHDIHGEKTSLFDMLLTYSGGLISLSVVVLIYAQSEISVAYWKLLLLALISADIGAGAIANFTKGTNLYYSGADKRKNRIIFIISHFIHPGLFFFVTDTFSIFSILLVVYVIGSAFVINAIAKREQQGVVAAFLMVVGISILMVSEITNPLLLWFFPLFMIKLLLAFAIRRFT